MNINSTLFFQWVVFALLMWFTAKFVWPPIMKALDERRQKIADGLSAADRAKTELASANKRVEAELSAGREQTTSLLADAERRAQAIASIPVRLRPPWVNTSQRPGATCLASMATTMH